MWDVANKCILWFASRGYTAKLETWRTKPTVVLELDIDGTTDIIEISDAEMAYRAELFEDEQLD
jgi:hypothetical protein